MDVAGLRRRRGREPGTPQPAATLGVEDQVQGEGAGGVLGISLNMCLLGSLVLLGLGILLFGEWYPPPAPAAGTLSLCCGPSCSTPTPFCPCPCGPDQTPLSPFQVVSQSLRVVSEDGA